MNRIQTTQLNLTLNILKMQNIQPIISQLEREYGINRHTVARYYREGGKARISRQRESINRFAH